MVKLKRFNALVLQERKLSIFCNDKHKDQFPWEAFECIHLTIMEMYVEAIDIGYGISGRYRPDQC